MPNYNLNFLQGNRKESSQGNENETSQGTGHGTIDKSKADLFNELGTPGANPQLEKALGIDHSKNLVKEIPLEDIRDFGGNYGQHKFQYNEEKVNEIADSIKLNGVLTPIIIRKDESGEAPFECLAGHTRRKAAQKAGLTTIPAIVKECDDEEALVIMAASNHQREDLLLSEKGWLYRIEYEGMKRQAGRKGKNCGQVDHNLKETRSIDELADKSNDSRKQIQRFIRLTYLIDSLLKKVDKKKIPVVAGVDLSYLTPFEQEHVEATLFAERLELTLEGASVLKIKSKEKQEAGSELTVDEVVAIIRETQKEKKVAVKKYEVADVLFPENVKKTERSVYIQKALQYVQEKGIEL